MFDDAAERVPGNAADSAHDSKDATAAAVGDDAKDAATAQALKVLFEGCDAIADSVLDGYYSIRDMQAFEKWIADRKSTLCNPALAQNTPKQKFLVLDLDNTLICRNTKSPDSFWVDGTYPARYRIQVHPDCLTFLHEMRAQSRLVAIFTSSSAVYAKNVVAEIERRYQEAFPGSTLGPFLTTMSSDDCTDFRGERRKDLLKFGPLSHVVYVDDDPYYSMKDQNHIVIQVRRYNGSKSEQPGLMAIVPLLTYLSSITNVSETARNLKKVWHKAGLVKVVPSTVGISC
ncbi:hypothetical protein PCANC_24783 [Puccinia coronata f. sp. avenae]|uniref:Mitochondrial import inner membrane translocase subunit TIM50 n=1 Tax=Puccinia coronata f. sp. avenae TaxID=200324 RepID=A0A2N5S8R3_9BASI|nr:hypothetical protein PCANC_24783 [Puccinia coronata f. sp. avenae]PLW09631.1 hypothetical protein PCASD_22551 [Puccinia coronata f. sp. avenae]